MTLVVAASSHLVAVGCDSADPSARPTTPSDSFAGAPPASDLPDSAPNQPSAGGAGPTTNEGSGGQPAVVEPDELLPLTHARREGCAEFCSQLSEADCAKDSTQAACIAQCQMRSRFVDCGEKYDALFACLPGKSAICGGQDYGYVDGCGELQSAAHQCGEATWRAPNDLGDQCKIYCDELGSTACGASVGTDCKDYCAFRGNIPSCEDAYREALDCSTSGEAQCKDGQSQVLECQDEWARYWSCWIRVEEGASGPGKAAGPSGLPALTQEHRDDCDHHCDLVTNVGPECLSTSHTVCANDCRVAARYDDCDDEYGALFTCEASSTAAVCTESSGYYPRVKDCEQEHVDALNCRNTVRFTNEHAFQVCSDDCTKQVNAGCANVTSVSSCLSGCIFNSNGAPGCEPHFRQAQQCEGQEGYECQDGWPVSRARCRHHWQDFWACKLEVGNQ